MQWAGNTTRVVVADRAEARMYDWTSAGDLRLRERLENPAGRMPDRALATDRPGRAFDRVGPVQGQARDLLHQDEGAIRRHLPSRPPKR